MKSMTMTQPDADGGMIARGRPRVDGEASPEQVWCPVERALDRIGTRSAMLLLREAFYGEHRFDELARRSGLSVAVAAKRLRQLVADGLLTQRPYQEPGARTRHEYVLTERGRELFGLLVALADWGARLDGGQDGIEFVHAGCGARLNVTVRCEAGHEVPPGAAQARPAADRGPEA
ncbi:MAG TPA: helix-turn-helix domain-containing protein [Trebonia sp.]|nr:helix-turn-helix domain-containing protein [Trebonia sp.]